ncbi:MAG: hypothetical protein RLZZ450_5070 [Pseudomonadota bacterium]|jgi:methanogenic corrinoid protein MtbC1
MTPSYLRSVLANDSAGALRVVDEGLAAGVSAAQLELGLIVPAQQEIGRLWQENQITVAQEHLATSIAVLAISRLYPVLPRTPPHGLSALVACVEGEQHDLGARIGADFLEMAGFDVRFLGANVPTAKLVAALESRPVSLLGLSASIRFHLTGLRAAVHAARTVAPLLPIVVGGRLLESTPGLAEELGVQAFGASADQLAQACRQLLGLGTELRGAPESA